MASQPLRWSALVCTLPTLLVAPGPAGVFLLHWHGEDATHFHRFDSPVPNDWHARHAEQHPREAAADHHDGDRVIDHHHDGPHGGAPMVVLTKNDLARASEPSSFMPVPPNLLARGVVQPAGMTLDPAAPTLPRPPNGGEACLIHESAAAALLLRNHALLI